MQTTKSAATDTETLYLAYLIAMFFAAQFLYYLADAGFHSRFGGVDPFVVDLSFMKDHFWQSLFYYHIAPPLYILYVALFKFYFPPDGETGFYILHSLLGAYAVYSLYKVQRTLGINPVLAAFLTLTFILSPSFNFEETSSFYDFPTACLLLISTWHLARLFNHPRFATAFGFFAIVALACSIRSLYHVLIYMAPVILITLIALKQHWKMILLASLLPFLFVFSVYLKNTILFDAFTTSSYFGETLDTIAMQRTVNLEEREEGIRRGFFSGLALCPSSADCIGARRANSLYTGHYCYAVIANPYREAYIKQLGKDYKDIPALSCDPVIGSSTGVLMPHRNCLGNIGMSKEYQKNAVQAILHYPSAYWAGIKSAWTNYFSTTVRYYGSISTFPQSLSINWLQPENTICSGYLLLFLPTLIFFSFIYLLYSKRGILLFLCLYFSALLITTYCYTYKHFDLSHEHWGFKPVLIIWFLAILVLMILIAGLARVLFAFIKNENLIRPAASYNKRMIVLYLLGNIIFTTLVLTLLTGISQQRYRFYIDGMYIILLGLFIQTMILPLFGGKKAGR